MTVTIPTKCRHWTVSPIHFSTWIW